MTIYAIAVHHFVHTCPANPEPHPTDTTRRIIHTAPGQPCRQPVTIRIGNIAATIPCGRHEPYDRQCGACRPIITTIQIANTTTAGTAH